MRAFFEWVLDGVLVSIVMAWWRLDGVSIAIGTNISISQLEREMSLLIIKEKCEAVRRWGGDGEENSGELSSSTTGQE